MAAKTILLDTGPLGIAANPRTSPATEAFNRWLFAQVGQAALICIPEVADHEVRRELIRGQRFNSLRKLDILQVRFAYLPITTRVMRHAAELWAQARNLGKPGADSLSLDGDVIIAAQASLLQQDGDDVIVATTTPRHFVHLVPASNWQDIA